MHNELPVEELIAEGVGFHTWEEFQATQTHVGQIILAWVSATSSKTLIFYLID